MNKIEQLTGSIEKQRAFLRAWLPLVDKLMTAERTPLVEDNIKHFQDNIATVQNKLAENEKLLLAYSA